MVPCGECAMSMMLNKQVSPDNLCELAGVSIFRMKSVQNIRKQLEALVENANIKVETIQMVMTGVNGNPENDRLYQPVLDELFSSRRRSICNINSCSVRTIRYRL